MKKAQYLHERIKTLEKYVAKIKDSSKIKLNISDQCKNIIDRIKEYGKIDYNKVKMHDKQPSDKEIIKMISGGDMTGGSCASAGLTYIGQKSGMNVLDFRGGKSREFFAKRGNLKELLKLPNVKSETFKVKKEASGVAKIIKELPKNKEYYMIAGSHASIIRNTDNGVEYLELQSRFENGWKSFETEYKTTADTLHDRFKCRKTVDRSKVGTKKYIFEKEMILIDVDSLKGSEDLREILGYINTASDKQKKGASGNVK